MLQKTTKLPLFVRKPFLVIYFAFVLSCLVAVSIFAISHPADATTPTLNFQARLLTSTGAVVPDGDYNVEFKIYSGSGCTPSTGSGCTTDWTEDYYGGSTDNRLRVADGYLSANLGSLTAFNSSIPWGQQLWLSINIGGTTDTGSPTLDGAMFPYLTLTSVPAAMSLDYTDGTNTGTLAFTSTLSGNDTITLPDASGTVCLATSGGGSCSTQGTGYILNQSATPGSAQTGNFNITGTGVAATLQAATFDTTSAGTLNIGTTNATGVAIGSSSETGTITLGQATGSNTINIGSAVTGSATQTIGIGTSSSSGTTTNVTLGSSVGDSSTTIQSGAGDLALLTGNSTGATGSILIQSGDSSSGTSGNVSIDTGVSAVSSGSNLEDDTFESGTDGYVVGYNASLAQSAVQAHSGSDSLAVTNTSTSYWGIYGPWPGVDINAGQLYDFSLWVRGTYSESVTASMDWIDGSEGLISNSAATVTDSTTGWTQLSFSGAAPTGAINADVQITGDDPGGTTYIDDVTISGGTSTPAVLIGVSNAAAVDIGNDNEAGATTLQGGSGGVAITTESGDAITVGNTNSNIITVGNSTDTEPTTLEGEGISDTITGSASAPSDIIKTTTNNSAAFQIQTSSGSNVLTADTANNRVLIGNGAANVAGEALTIQTASNEFGFMQTNGSTSVGSYVTSNGQGQFGTYSDNALAFFTDNGQPAETIYTNGTAMFQGYSNSTSGFQVQNAIGTTDLNVDTLDGGVTLGSTNTPHAVQNWSTAGSNKTTLSDSPNTTGDLMMLAISIPSTSSTVSSVSGGGVSGWSYVNAYTDSADGYRTEIWMGTVNAIGSNTITVGFSGTGAEEISAQEFSAGIGAANWSVVASNTAKNTANPVVFPSVTATQNNELYWGYMTDGSPAINGSTTGFSYIRTADANSIAYGAGLTASTPYAPTASQNSSTWSSGVAVIISGSAGDALTVNGSETVASTNSTSAFQVQNASSASVFTADTTDNEILLGTNTNLLLQGSTATISNPQGQTGSEAFGASASVGGSGSVAVGKSASTQGSGVAVGDAAGANTGSIAVGYAANAGGGTYSISIGASSVASGNFSVSLGSYASAGYNYSIAIGAAAATTAVNQLVIGSATSGSGDITDSYIGSGVTDTSPTSTTVHATGGSGSNIAGASISLAGGIGTGTGNGGNINFEIAKPSGTSGSTANTLAQVASISGTNGAVNFQNAVDSTTAFQVQNAGSLDVLDLDTTDGRVGINTSTPGYALDVAGDANTSGAYRIGGTAALTNNTLNFTNTSSAANVGFSGAASAAGNVLNLTGQGGSTSGAGAAGGAVILQGGEAGGTGGNDGGNLTLQGGTATETGIGGQLNLEGGYAGIHIITTLYAYPTLSSWSQIESASPTVSSSILDICAPDGTGSGCDGSPADAVSTVWIPTITALENAGVTPLYYISTNFGATSLSVVEGEMQNALTWYGIASPTFDEMDPSGTCTNGGNPISCTTYYNDLYTYAVNEGASTVLFNPGSTYNVSTADMFGPKEIIQLFEGDSATFESTSFPGWMSSYPASEFIATVFGGSSSTIGTDTADAYADGFGNIYENDETGTPNYSTLPAFWSTELSDVSAAAGTEGGVNIDAGAGGALGSGSVDIGDAYAGTISIGNNSLAHTIDIDADGATTNQAINIGSGVTGTTNYSAITIGSDNASTSSVTTIQGGDSTSGGVLVQAAGNGAVIIGNQASSTTNTIDLGAVSTANSDNVNINTNNNTSDTGTVTIGGSGEATSNVILQAAGITNTITGSTTAPSDTVKTTTNSAVAFQIQNSSGNSLLDASTSSNQILLGASNNLNGSLAFADSGDSNTLSVGTDNTGTLNISVPGNTSSSNNLPQLDNEADYYQSSTTSSTWTNSYTDGSGTDRYLLLQLNDNTTTCGGNTQSITYGGTSMTLLGKGYFGAQNNAYCEWTYGLKAPASGANNIVVTVSGGTLANSEYSMSVSSWSRVNQTTPYGSYQTAAGDGEAGAPELSYAWPAGRLVVDNTSIFVGTSCTDDAQVGPAAGQTPVLSDCVEPDVSSNYDAVDISSKQSTGKTMTMAWGNGGGGWGYSAVDLIGDSGGTATFGDTGTSGTTDTADNSNTDCSLFTSGVTGTVSTLTIQFKNINGTYKSAQAGMYSNTSEDNLGSLMGSSGTITLSSGSNTFTLGSSVQVYAGTSYWLCSMSNLPSGGSYVSYNNLVYDASTTQTEAAVTDGFTYGTWPTTLAGASFNGDDTYEMVANVSLNNPSANVVSINNTGQVTLQNASNSSSAFQVQNASGASLLTVDTFNNQVDIGGSLVGSTYSDSSSYTTTQTQVITTNAFAYNLSNTVANPAAFTLTDNITGLPNIDGTMATIMSATTKTSGTNTASLKVEINSQIMSTVAVSSAATQHMDYMVMYSGGTWHIIGYGPPSGTTGTIEDADYAEWIDYSGDTAPQAGDVLTMGSSPDSVQDSDTAYDPSLIGVVSTSPYQVGGVNDGHSVILALTGRVPVKVSTQNGNILPGDPLTSSPTPGVAMLATGPGNIIGTALEAYDGTQPTNQITVQLHVGYDDPNNTTSPLTGSTLNTMGNAMIGGNLGVNGSTVVTDNSATALQVQNSSATAMFTVDTSDGDVIIGSGTNGDTSPTLLVLDTGTSKGDPSEVNGAMYYNATDEDFRCGENGVWRSCSGGLVNSSTSASSAINGTTSQTNFGGGTNNSYGVLANDCQPGVTYLITAAGTYTTGSNANQTGTFYLDEDGTSTNLGSTGAMPLTASSTLGWQMSAQMTCDSTTSVEVQGTVTVGNSNTASGVSTFSNTSTKTWSTSAHTLYVGLTPSDSGQSWTMRQFIVQRIAP